MAEKNQKRTPFELEMLDTANKILEYKEQAEANVVAILYKKPDEFYNVSLTLEDFSKKINVWRVFFQIGYDIIVNEHKAVLDDMTIGFYLGKHPKLREKFTEYGGYATVSAVMAYVKVDNLEGYIAELRKWNALLKLVKAGFPIKKDLSDFADMPAEKIYSKYEAHLNDTFANIDSDVKSYDICDGIYDLIEKLDEGQALGLEYYNMPTLTQETGGQYLGAITLLGGISNSGKSTVARSTTIPSIIKHNEKVVVMINEDSLEKWQREMLVFVCNCMLDFDIQKHIVRDGRYSPEVKQKLYEAANWLEEHTQNHMITIIPFIQYETAKAIKTIRKYAALGVKYFVLDTYKMDAGKVSSNAWLQMQQNMVEIKNTVKTEALNVHILITFQLEKGSSVMRYYTQNNIGMAKNIVDVAATCIMIRDLFDDELPGEKNALKVYRWDKDERGRPKKVEVVLDSGRKYQIFFIVKNQEGAANAYQIVAEHDKSRNIIREVGFTNVNPDF